jgi:hypothetical protein
VLVLVLVALNGAEGRAQDSAATVPCAGQRIVRIDASSRAPRVAWIERVPIVARVVAAVHVPTRELVIRRFLLLREGDRCDELRRLESQRILRAQHYIADARVDVLASGSPADSTVVLRVTAIDEAVVLLGGRANAAWPPLRSLRLGNSNLDGRAIYVSSSWQEGGSGYRDGFGARFMHGQLFGRPYILDALAIQRPLGEQWDVLAAHPYLTDLQRIAWRARMGSTIDFVSFPVTRAIDRTLRLDRRYYDVGGIVRIGAPGRMSLFGASVSSDDERPVNQPYIISDSGLVVDDAPAPATYAPHRMARVNLLWGVRDIAFVPVRGFDALNATQDMPIGFQAGMLFGRSLSVLGSEDDDIFLASDMYAAIGGERGVLRLAMRGEGRRANDTERWDGILLSGRVSESLKLGASGTLIASAEMSGGWRLRVPYGFSLADRTGGIRGHATARSTGAQRTVGRIEGRWSIGRVSNVGVGVAAFADGGQLWAGGAPYGVSTPFRSSAGISLLAALPPESHRLWRVDLSIARRPELGAPRFEIRLWGDDQTRLFWREPGDVERARERTVPASVFRWP